MDTQRLILFVIFSFSALFLWEAWQRQNRPAPPPVTAAKQAAPAATPMPGDVPVPSLTNPGQGPAPGTAPAAIPGAPAIPGTTVDAAAAARTIVVKTDLYTAAIDPAGGVITRVALDAHREVDHPDAPYQVLLKTAERTYVAQSGLLGTGMPNHRTVYEVLPGPRELAAGADSLELKLSASAPNGDKVVQVLTFHRGSYVDRRRLRRHQQRRGADLAVRVFPADARHQADRVAQPDGADVVHGSGDLQRDRQVQEDRVHRDRQARRRPDQEAPVHEVRGQRLGGHGRALFRRGLAAVRREEDAARVLHAQARQRPLFGRRDRAGGHRCARGDRRGARAAVRRARRTRTCSQARQGARSGRRLRHLHRHRRAAVLAAEVAARLRAQLGVGDHPAHHHHQERVLSAESTRARGRWRR